MKYLILFILSFSAIASVGEEILIRGKVGSDFDDKKVKVIDSFNQTYYLPKSVFPKGFNFKQGESFAVEVHESVLDKIKIIKK